MKTMKDSGGRTCGKRKNSNKKVRRAVRRSRLHKMGRKRIKKWIIFD